MALSDDRVEWCSAIGVAGEILSVADLGCGLGYTTAILAQLFPGALVTGTNVHSLQWDVAFEMSKQNRFRLATDSAIIGKSDLVFASEYFEHFEDPVGHLRCVINNLQPKVMIIANAFGSTSIGHFNSYIGADGAARVPSKMIGREFGNELRRCGFQKIATRIWNNRPAIWMRA